MSIEISHIVANGCSFTYCQGLPAPWVEGWPALLGKRLGVPVVNISTPGSGNDGILRRTYEYFYKNKHLDGKPLYVVAFSHATRREEFFKKYRGKTIDEYFGLDLSASDIDFVAGLSYNETASELYELAHVMNMSYEACERKKFISWNSVVNLFKANNIPYITADYMPTYDDDVESYMKKNYNEIYSECLQDKNYIGKLSELTRKFKKLDCGHDPIEAMPVVCNEIYNKIVENYGTVNRYQGHGQNFLRLKEFFSERSQILQNWNLWLQHT